MTRQKMRSMSWLHRQAWVVAGFGLAGLLSILLLSAVAHVPYLGDRVPFFLVGSVFGLSMAVYFWMLHRLRSVWKLALFVATCSTAFYLSFFSALFAFSHLRLFGLSSPNTLGPGPDAFFVGGSVGALFVLLGTFFLLLPEQKWWRVLAKSVCWCLAGGGLGILGAKLGSLFAADRGAWWRPFGNELPLYVVWQFGMALLLGIVLEIEGVPSSATAGGGPSPEGGGRWGSGLSPSGVVFFAGALILLVYFLLGWEVRGSILRHH